MRPTLLIAIAGLLLAILWLILSPSRQLRDPPAAPVEVVPDAA
jgi:hypothetical protein